MLACLRFCSQCSKSCGKGLQMREVRCLTPEKKHSYECDSSTKPVQEQICNTIPCSPQVSGQCMCQQNCDRVCFDLPANLSPSVCSQMKTAETYVNSVSWWCKPDSASTPTTRKSAVPPVFRVLSVPRDTDRPMADIPCAQVVED